MRAHTSLNMINFALSGADLLISHKYHGNSKLKMLIRMGLATAGFAISLYTLYKDAHPVVNAVKSNNQK